MAERDDHLLSPRGTCGSPPWREHGVEEGRLVPPLRNRFERDPERVVRDGGGRFREPDVLACRRKRESRAERSRRADGDGNPMEVLPIAFGALPGDDAPTRCSNLDRRAGAVRDGPARPRVPPEPDDEAGKPGK